MLLQRRGSVRTWSFGRQLLLTTCTGLQWRSICEAGQVAKHVEPCSGHPRTYHPCISLLCTSTSGGRSIIMSGWNQVQHTMYRMRLRIISVPVCVCLSLLGLFWLHCTPAIKYAGGKCSCSIYNPECAKNCLCYTPAFAVNHRQLKNVSNSPAPLCVNRILHLVFQHNSLFKLTGKNTWIRHYTNHTW